MIAERHQIAQQFFTVYLFAFIGNPHTAPVGLAGDQAIRLQQMAVAKQLEKKQEEAMRMQETNKQIIEELEAKKEEQEKKGFQN